MAMAQHLWSLMTLVTLGLCAGDPPDGPCSLVVNGEKLMSYKATHSPDVTWHFVDIVNEGSGDCQLRMLLVGGGGNISL